MIAIVLFTCDRPAERVDYAWRTFNSLKLLSASEDIWFHLADDGSNEEFREKLMEVARSRYGNHTSTSNSEGAGYGASYNIASQVTHGVADIVLPLEDDWEVCRSFTLDGFAKVLREGHFNCIRMGYIGYTDTLRATFRYYGNQHYLELDPESPEKHVFAGGPRLETVEFEKAIGAWPKVDSAGGTELAVAGMVAARQGIAWPIDAIKPRGDLFSHIGSRKAGDGAPGSHSPMAEVNV